MTLTLIPLGGFGEVGRNSLALEYDDEVIILDLGLHLERYIQATNDLDNTSKSHLLRKLYRSGALPELRFLRKKMKNIKAVVCSHAHLDHVGAVPFLAKKLKCPIHATAFTAKVIDALAQDKWTQVNTLIHDQGEIIPITKNLSIEFIRVAHSTPQSSIIAVHTPDGVVIYGNDYKNDQTPPFEEATNIPRLKELVGLVRVLLLDSLYAPKSEKSLSESFARDEVLSLQKEFSSSKGLIVASTFSSHIYRLQTLCDLADSLGREIVFMGRSLHKYISAATAAGLVDLSTRGTVFKFAKQTKSFLAKMDDPKKYFLITTGHQGEPQAVLNRMVEELYSFTKEDTVLFSCSVIPVPINVNQRAVLDAKLENKGVTLHTDVHVSGHASGKDQEELIRILQPDFYIPSHGDDFMSESGHNIALSAGLSEDRIKIVKLGQRYSF